MTMNLSNKKILVTGGAGFLGGFVVSELLSNGASQKNIIIPRSNKFDLRIWESCQKVVHEVDSVVHLAASVGGIGYNRENPATLFYDNAIMGIQLMEAARLAKVAKFVALGTICAYPNHTPVPFKESDIWNGYPEVTNAPYGLAKKMMLVQSQAYRDQYNFNSIYLLPVNLYGPGDNFNQNSSHVIPALIKKVYEAKRNNTNLSVWGTGSASREFLFVEDAAKGIVQALLKYNKSEPVNLGVGREILIKDLVNLVCDIMGFKGEIIWDASKPDGQSRRMLCTKKAKEEFDFRSNIELEEGLKQTINWYMQRI